MTKHDSIVVVYASGCYGHWIDWCINYFGLGKDYALPFDDKTGTSHQMPHRLLSGLLHFNKYLESDAMPVDVVGLHPVIRQQHNVSEVLAEVSKKLKKVVFVTPDQDSIMFAWNNKWSKIRSDWLLPYQYSVKENVKHWGKDNWSDMDVWEKREFLSFWWWPARLNEHSWKDVYKKSLDWDQYPAHKNLNIHTVTLSQLRDNCPKAIIGILDYLGLKLQRSEQDLIDICNKWASLQRHSCKDRLIADIINSMIDPRGYLDWSQSELTLVDEATIQMILRDLHNLEIKCYNLNEFPTNSKHLRDLTFNV